MVLWMEAWSRCSQLHSSPGSNACGKLVFDGRFNPSHGLWVSFSPGLTTQSIKTRQCGASLVQNSRQGHLQSWTGLLGSLQPKAKGSLVLLHRFSLPISQFWLMAHLPWPHPPPLELGTAGLLKISPMVWSNQP